MFPLSISCVVQEECKSLEEFSGIPVAKLKANDPSITELKFGSKDFGEAEAYVLGMVLQVRHKIRAAHQTISRCILKPVTPAANRVFVFDFWQKNTCVTSVNLGYNRIGNEGAKAIADMLGVGFQPLVTPHQPLLSYPHLHNIFHAFRVELAPR